MSMGVYIKGMEMPQSCDDCRLKKSYVYAVRSEECAYYCRNVDPYVSMGKRPDWCPLIDVPPHGRLIDADALLRDFPIRLDHYDKEHGSKHFVYGVETVMDYVSEMPTIIEAEEGA